MSSIASEQKLIDLEARIAALEDEVREIRKTAIQRLEDELDLAVATERKTLKLKRG